MRLFTIVSATCILFIKDFTPINKKVPVEKSIVRGKVLSLGRTCMPVKSSEAEIINVAKRWPFSHKRLPLVKVAFYGNGSTEIINMLLKGGLLGDKWRIRLLTRVGSAIYLKRRGRPPFSCIFNISIFFLKAPFRRKRCL